MKTYIVKAVVTLTVEVPVEVEDNEVGKPKEDAVKDLRTVSIGDWYRRLNADYDIYDIEVKSVDIKENDDVVEGLRNGFIHHKTRNTRAQIEEYLEQKMPGKWDEWNVRMTKLEWDREDVIAKGLEGR